jgi:hypothetical protein
VAALPVVLWFQVGTVPVKPEYGAEVAVIVPVPVGPNEPPVPTRSAFVFVPEVMALKAKLVGIAGTLFTHVLPVHCCITMLVVLKNCAPGNGTGVTSFVV